MTTDWTILVPQKWRGKIRWPSMSGHRIFPYPFFHISSFQDSISSCDHSQILFDVPRSLSRILNKLQKALPHRCDLAEHWHHMQHIGKVEQLWTRGLLYEKIHEANSAQHPQQTCSCCYGVSPCNVVKVFPPERWVMGSLGCTWIHPHKGVARYSCCGKSIRSYL